MDIIASSGFITFSCFSLFTCVSLSPECPVFLLQCIIQNSQFPQTCIYYAAVFVFCERLTTTMCFTWLKRWHRGLAARCVSWLWELLTLSFRCFLSWYVIHRSPSLLYATLYEPTNWTRPKSLAPWVMMPVTLVGTSKSTWKKPKKKEQKRFSRQQIWNSSFENMDGGGGNHVCCIYLIIPYWTIYVNWIIHLYISTATRLRQFLIKLKSYIPSYPWPSVIIIKQQVWRSLHKMETGEMSISVVHGAT